MTSFILENIEEIVAEWESFAKTVSPASATMSSLALRDHARQMLEAIAKDIKTSQSDNQQALKSKGLGPVFHGVETAAAAHGALRHAVGFDLRQLVAEFRALRATVLRLWIAKGTRGDANSAYEMARFNEAIDQALAESVATYADELAKSRDTFLAILGHDLRSPSGALSGVLRILSNPGTDANRSEALKIGTRSVSAMSAMIRDLLEYTRTRLGKGIPIAPAEANLESVCKAIIDEVSVAHSQPEMRLEAHGGLDGIFDSERMHQVVSNLVNNAVQHGTRSMPVCLVLRGDAEFLSLEVMNAGDPIPPDLLQVIFDPLVQLPTGESDPIPSTNLGLGLFIAREIVLAHGGNINASSSAQSGTTFTVKLPRKESASPDRSIRKGSTVAASTVN